MNNREIKFRAFDSLLKTMIPDYCYMEGMSFQGYDLTNNSHQITAVMQYTGRKDKNEKEIYEGDIVTATFFTSYLNHGVVGRIVMDDYMWCLIQDNGDGFSLNRLAHPEVIGNIYEHTHLLSPTQTEQP